MFFTPNPFVCMDVLAYADVITKLIGFHLLLGMWLRCARGRSTTIFNTLSPKNEATELGYVQTPCSTRGSGMSMRAYAQL